MRSLRKLFRQPKASTTGKRRGAWGKIRKLFRRGPRPAANPLALERSRRGPMGNEQALEGIRRWESAETTRLNRAHWQNATGRPINEDIDRDLDYLRARATYEAANNPTFEGVISTHAGDVVGPEGPRLRVLSDSDDYNDSLEDVFEDWSASPDATATMSWAELLQCWIRGGWLAGEFLAQLVSDMSVTGAPRLRILDIDPRRLGTPMNFVGDPNIAFGIRRNKMGRPLTYYVAQPEQIGAYTVDTGKPTPVPAADMLHGFRVLESGQLRGIPWAAPCLDSIADLRDFDHETLDAARAAASMAVVYHSNHPDAQFIPAEGERDHERQADYFLPPGWEATQLNPSHPGPNFLDYRRAKMSDMGRPVGMPGIIVLLAAENVSLSAARFDNQRYCSALNIIRSWLQHRALNRIAAEIAREAELLRLVPPRPKRVRYQWAFWNLPQVDPHRDAQAQEVRLTRTKTSTLTDELRADGKDLDDYLDTKEKEREAFKRRKMVHPDDAAQPTPQLSEGKNPKPSKQEPAAK